MDVVGSIVGSVQSCRGPYLAVMDKMALVVAGE